MGVLQLPRYYFKGYNYWNPSTFNNNDYSSQKDYAHPIQTYDPANAQLNCPYLHSQGVYDGNEFKKWSIVAIPTDPIPRDPNEHGKLPPAEWDYYGGNQCGFVTQDVPDIQDPNFSKPQDFTHITGYTDKNGQYNDSSDPWLNLPLQFNNTGSPAKLVDINPTAFWSSQIFADNFTLGSSECGFTAPVNYRMHSRWIGSTHNYNTNNELIIAGQFSAVFQTCFHKKDIKFYGAASQLQQALESAPNAAGLMLRFTNYDTIYFQGDKFKVGDQFPNMEIIAKLYQEYAEALEAYQEGRTTQKPRRPINRAYSRVVGWIGLWNPDELVSVPEGRFLIPFQNTNGKVKEIKVQAKGLPPSYYKKNKQEQILAQVTLGPAMVEVKISEDKRQIERLAVDLSTAMPEHDISGQKADFGNVKLALQLPDGLHPIATLPNDQQSYEKTAGVVDITTIPTDITVENIKNNPLVIQVETYCAKKKSQTLVPALIETPLTAQTDQRGIYANQPNPSWNPDAEMSKFTVKVRYYGRLPLPEGTTLALTQDEEDVELFYQDQNGNFQPYTQHITVCQEGEVTIGVSALKPGMPDLIFEPVLPGKEYVGAAFNLKKPETVASAFYAVVRCLPFHNAMADAFAEWLKTNPDVREVNQRVFSEVYGTYHLMYPVMDFINSPLKFQEWRGRILRITDPEFFESAQYMPVTRALSAGQRRILELYCDYLSKIPQSSLARRRVSLSLGHGSINIS